MRAALKSLWFFLLLVGVVYLATVPLNLKSDVLDMLLSDSGEQSELLVAKGLMSAGAGELRLALVSDSSAELEDAVSTLKSSLLKSKVFLNLKKIAKDKFFKSFSASRAYILDPDALELLKSKDSVDLVVGNIQRKLSSPLGGFYSTLLPYDPLLLSTESLEVLTSLVKGEEVENVLFQNDQSEHRAFFFIEVGQDRSAPEQITGELNQIISSLEESHPEIEVRWSGFSRFAADSAQRMKRDINRVGLFASLLILALVCFTFRRIEPLLLTGLSLISGFLFAFSATHFILGGVHLMTIGFGSSLMGAGADYAVHFQCSKYFSGSGLLVARSIIWGAVTSIVAFLFLMIAGFPGLTELALFSACSLLGSSLSVLLFFKDSGLERLDYSSSFLSNILSKSPYSLLIFSSGEGRESYGWMSTLFIGILSALSCYLFSSFDDNPTSFQKPSKYILEDELWLQQKLVPQGLDGHLLISADSELALENQLLELSKKITSQALAGSVVSKASVTRSQSKRQSSFETYSDFLKTNQVGLTKQLSELGFDDALVQKAFEISEQQEPSLTSSEEVFPGELLKELKLGQSAGKHWAAAYLYNISDKELLLGLLDKEGSAQYYNHRETLNKLFSDYRLQAIYCLALAYLIIFILLVLVSGAKQAVRIVLPAVVAGLSTIALVGILGFSLNFFGILALVIVLGLAVDYGIFLDQSREERQVSNMAISLSVLTTAGSFSLLMLSETPVLAMFGAIISIGVVTSWLMLHLSFGEDN